MDHSGPSIFEQRAALLGYLSLVAAAALWPLFLIEFLWNASAGMTPRTTAVGALACLCPPLRMGAANARLHGRIWLPRLGWIRATDEVRERLERAFGLPMIIISLMILPVLLIEFGPRELITERAWLRILVHLSTGIIWFAFALEFIVMCSVAKRKLQYCRDHWLDLAIILLPLLSFLRSLRIVRATRLARLAKIQQLAKMSRIYRLRGLAFKAFRALLLFGVLNRLLRVTPDQRLRGLRQKLAEKEAEVRSLQRQIESLEKSLECEVDADLGAS
jgi:voltage-gated potassium channel